MPEGRTDLGNSTRLSWSDAFRPVTEARELEVRPQQDALGNAVLRSYTNKTNLIAEARTGTGKSFAYLVPAILAVKDKKRTVISTETLALMDQLVDRDLPQLHKIFGGGFKFRALKGRSNYLCTNRMRMWMSNAHVQQIAKMTSLHAFGDGERRDVERVLKMIIDNDTWWKLSGEADYCSANKCNDERCFSSRARTLALESNIVVTTHAMLRTDAEAGILGPISTLVVDEAHTLEKVLIDGWTEELSPWDITHAHKSVFEGLDRAADILYVSPEFREDTQAAFDDLDEAMQGITDFFQRLHVRNGDTLDKWNRANIGVTLQFLSGSIDDELMDSMSFYEKDVPSLFAYAQEKLGLVEKKLAVASNEIATVHSNRGIRKVNKGLTAVKKINHALALIQKSMLTRDGVVDADSTYYAVIGEGVILKTGETSVRIRVVPLDVSWRCKRTVWVDRTVILVSATLTDPIDESFKYTLTSLGLDDATELRVDSPFDYVQNQLVYITDAAEPPMMVNGAQVSIDELEQIIRASNGRTLALFTARAELDYAAAELKGRGLPWLLLVQDEKADKQKLADDFRSDGHSVLLATKSFFTGVDFPGDTCSTVAICKFPLPQYNALCKIQIAWWRKRGFPKWYEREALTTFAQAAGRLIRTSSDRGVIALLDQRVANPKHNVYATAMLGVHALHAESRIVSKISDIEAFLI